jgi:flagellar basal body-associated protein FliL
MDRSKVTIISVFIAIFLAVIAFLASFIFSSPQPENAVDVPPPIVEPQN